MKKLKRSLSRPAILVLLATATVAAVALVGCGNKTATSGGDTSAAGTTSEVLSGTLTVEGSDTMVNLAQAWAESFMSTNKDVSINVKGGGSGAGIASLINGTVDFANASRAVKDEEIQQGKDAGVDIVQTAVARDGIAIIVNPANGVTDISTDDLGKIYRGEITNWKDVGGTDGAIVLLGRDTSSGTYEFFQEKVVGKDAEYAKAMRNMQSNQAIVDEVKTNPQAIGYVGMGYEDPAIKVLTVDGTEANETTVRDGSYGLSRELFMDSNGAPTGLAKAYLDWILTESGQETVQSEGFVTLN